jgi:hypothetical protein
MNGGNGNTFVSLLSHNSGRVQCQEILKRFQSTSRALPSDLIIEKSCASCKSAIHVSLAADSSLPNVKGADIITSADETVEEASFGNETINALLALKAPSPDMVHVHFVHSKDNNGTDQMSVVSAADRQFFALRYGGISGSNVKWLCSVCLCSNDLFRLGDDEIDIVLDSGASVRS